jgi:hypothetical protein
MAFVEQSLSSTKQKLKAFAARDKLHVCHVSEDRLFRQPL